MNDSENLKNDDQLLTMMEEMQDQIEDLQNQIQMEQEKNLEAQKMISKVSSENLILRNKLQEKSERIEKMNESDLILKKNEELEKQIAEAQRNEKKAHEEAEATVEAVKKKARGDVEVAKRRYHEKVSSLAGREYDVSHREKAVSFRENNADTEINSKAEELIKDKISSLEMQYDNKKFVLKRQYENDNSRMLQHYKKKMSELNAKYHTMVAGYRGVVYFTLFYSILTTIITAYKTNAFAKDVVTFIMTIKNGVIAIGKCILVAAAFVARLGDMIPQVVLATIVHWIFVIGVCGAIIGGIGWLLLILGRKYIKFFKEKQADEISIFVGFITLAIVVFASDLIKSILSINLIGLMIEVFVGYTVLRGIIQAENIEAKKNILKGAGITIGCIVGVMAIGYLFGAIGLIAIPIGCLLVMGVIKHLTKDSTIA